MIKGHTVLGVIPARGGSKGIPRKNIAPLAGRPLIAWTIEAARRSRYLDRLIVSSDDPAILAVAAAMGCETPFVRPAALATDEANGMGPVLHALDTLPEHYAYVALLQPTSPLRLAEDIDACLDACGPGRAPCCVSVCEATHSPYWMYFAGEAGRLVPVLPGAAISRRQDLPKAYALNGAVYAARTDWLRTAGSFLTPETVCHVMPAERSVDIDSPMDLAICEALLRDNPSAREKRRGDTDHS